MEKVKYLLFTTSDGESWGLKKSFVAEHRAKHYAKTDPETTFQEEFDFVMNDTFEAQDWLQNNMKGSDYEHALIQISKPKDHSFIEKFNDDDGAEITENILVSLWNP